MIIENADVTGVKMTGGGGGSGGNCPGEINIGRPKHFESCPACGTCQKIPDGAKLVKPGNFYNIDFSTFVKCENIECDTKWVLT